VVDTAWRRPSVDHQCAGIITETGVALVAHMRHARRSVYMHKGASS